MIIKFKSFVPCFFTCSLLFAVLLCSVQCAATAPAPPQAKVIIVPARPHPNAVWFEGRWVWKRYHHEYIWVPGYWKYRRGHRYIFVY